ncbi:MAG: MerR family DNA-binding protein [Sphaerobacter sp.]|nr:MerR family DNA-binding protein [Sphaerobacter sp.]
MSCACSRSSRSRAWGFSLGEIKAFLAAPPGDLREVLAQQGAMLRERRAHLDAIIQAIERLLQMDGCDGESLVTVIQVIQMDQNTDWRKKYFTDE